MSGEIVEKGDGYVITKPENVSATPVPDGEAPGGALSWQYPGHINIANERGFFHGCTCVRFANDLAMNKFFSDKKNVLVVDVKPDGHGGVYAFYTKQLDGEEEEEFAHFQRAMGWHMQEWRKKRQEAKELEREQRLAAAEEAERLRKLGGKCEADKHVEQLRNRARKGKE